jgi:cation-transporting ATPase 13A1
MQVATFAVNYKGHPFMASLSENKPLRNSLVAATAFVIVLALELMPEFNLNFELVLFPSEQYKWFLVTLIAVDFALCFVVEWICSKIFEN